MKLKIFSIFFAILIFAVQIYATAQYPDKIIYNGKEYDLHSNPMEDYFERFPNKKPKGGLRSTALRRGYVATFEVAENVLILKDIEIQVRKETADKSFETEWKSVLAEVVPGNDKLKIDWFNGLLVVPHGKLINYVHMGYGSTFENYILLEIADGNFVKAKEFGYKDYEKFKERQFAAFRQTEEYKQLIERERKSKDFDEKFFNDFLRNFITNYASKILVD